MSVASDTGPAAAKVWAETFRAMPPSTKWRLLDDAFKTARDLHAAGMTRRPVPKPDLGKAGAFLPNGATAKAGLNKSILDAGWAQFTTILTGKAAEAGRQLIAVPPHYTSQRCSACGMHVRKSLSVRTHVDRADLAEQRRTERAQHPEGRTR